MSPHQYDSGAEVWESTSKFDGSTELNVGVAALQDQKLKIGAYRNSKMKKSDLVLIAEVIGAENIKTEGGLQVSIDGKIHSLNSIDKVTDIHIDSLSSKVKSGYTNYSSKRFVINKDLLAKILNAKMAVFRVNYLSGTYTEDVLATPKNWIGGEQYSAKSGLKEFMRRAFPESQSGEPRS